jgi:hypothetical protein
VKAALVDTIVVGSVVGVVPIGGLTLGIRQVFGGNRRRLLNSSIQAFSAD